MKSNKTITIIASLLLVLTLTACTEERPPIIITNPTETSVAEISMNDNNIITSISTSNNYTKVAGITNLSDAPHDFIMNNNNSLKYTGISTKHFHVAVTLSVKGSGANDVMKAIVIKTNSSGSYPLYQGQIQQKLGSIGDVASTAIHVAPILSTNDSISLYIMNENDADDFTVTYMNMFALGVGKHY